MSDGVYLCIRRLRSTAFVQHSVAHGSACVGVASAPAAKVRIPSAATAGGTELDLRRSLVERARGGCGGGVVWLLGWISRSMGDGSRALRETAQHCRRRQLAPEVL